MEFTEKEIEAFKLLLQKSYDVVKKQTHKDDWQSREYNFKKVTDALDNKDYSIIEDTICDLNASFDWS